MYLILSFQTGRRTEGILLAASPGRMRIVIRRRNDTVELRLIEGRWIADDGEPVEIESWIAGEHTGIPGLFSEFVPRTYGACN